MLDKKRALCSPYRVSSIAHSDDLVTFPGLTHLTLLTFITILTFSKEAPMPKAIRIHQHGGPEVLKWEDVDPGRPGPGEALVRHEAVGLNYIDVYHRTGLYPLPALPGTPGLEAAGVVAEIGPGVNEVTVGDRVAYAGVPPGAYAEIRRIPAHRL